MIKLLIDLARDHDAFLIYDEAYRHLYYEADTRMPLSTALKTSLH